jgi:hypothetical protein
LKAPSIGLRIPERAGALAKEKTKAAVCLSMSIVTQKDE